MANVRDILRQVRLAVHDPDPPPSFRAAVLYPDDPYRDAIRFALNKLNLDLRNLTDLLPLPPWTVETLPEVLSFLLIKLAVIQMAQIRGAEAAGSVMVETEGASAGITKIQVPDLLVEEAPQTSASEVKGPAYWKALWDRLQKEYDGEITRLVSSSAPSRGMVEVGIVSRVSCRTGGLVAKQLDHGLPATTLSVAYVGRAFTASWLPIYSDLFSYYDLHHITPDGTDTVLTTRNDNQDTVYSATVVLSPGVHSFYVVGGTRNEVETRSNAVELRVV